MKMLLTLVGLIEAATGLALGVAPSLVARLLLGADCTGIALPIAHLTGIALFALGAGCLLRSLWLGMTIYNALATLFLAYLGIRTEWTGTLLWPRRRAPRRHHHPAPLVPPRPPPSSTRTRHPRLISQRDAAVPFLTATRNSGPLLSAQLLKEPRTLTRTHFQ